MYCSSSNCAINLRSRKRKDSRFSRIVFVPTDAEFDQDLERAQKKFVRGAMVQLTDDDEIVTVTEVKAAFSAIRGRQIKVHFVKSNGKKSHRLLQNIQTLLPTYGTNHEFDVSIVRYPRLFSWNSRVL